MSNHNDVNLSAIEDTVSELQLLSKRQPLRDEDLLRAKDLMASLKEAGYTNKEIKAPINKKDLTINNKPSMAGFCLFNELSYTGFARTKTGLSRDHITFKKLVVCGNRSIWARLH
jgi:hypothetical protein